MKKQYFAPEMEIVDINMNQQLLAGSNLDVTNGVDLNDATPGSSLDADAPLFYDFVNSYME